MKHHLGSILFSIVTAILIFGYGFAIEGINTGLQFLVVILALSVLEVSLSFDNAVANARVLATMDKVWQQRFLTWGMLIAVFGMRIVFPLIIVAIAGSISMFDALTLAMYEPLKYAEVLTSAEVLIKGFGGAFLLLVGLEFFFDEEKENHWIKPVESKLIKLGALKSSAIVITLIVLSYFSTLLPIEEAKELLVSGVLGIIAHEIIKSFGELVGEEDATTTVAKAGLMSFLYLEILDASFSFDGVIGAFAISTNIFVIAAGLGIGAMFVRSLTIHLVEAGTLAEYKFLEHGAFWSIIVLAFIMFAGTVMHISEIITGVLSVALIGIALAHSIYNNKKGI
jgi:hypothetical protein